MSTTTDSMTAALPASRTRLSGQAVAIPSAVLAIVSFFLPWFAYSTGTTVLASLSGLQIASGVVLTSSDGAEIFRGSATSFLVPAVGVLALVLAFLARRRGYEKELDGFALIIASTVTLLILWEGFVSAQKVIRGEGVDLQLQIGMFGAYLGLLGMLVAGGLHLRTVGIRKPSFRATLGAWGFMSPATILVAVFFFIPAILLLFLSMTDLASANFNDPWNFVGLDNYKRMFSDPFFPKILGNTFRYVILTLGLFNVGLALTIALLTSLINRRAAFIFRLLWLLPRITPSVIFVLMWRRIAHQPPFGILNQLLAPFGVEPRYWLPEEPWLFVILVNGFVGASFGLIIFSSAIESIPKDLITAAKVDGASVWQTIRDITIPLIRWPLLFVTTYQTLSLLVSFEYILLLTEGGPGLFTTEVWSLTAYKRALFTYFGNHQWGYGAAWGFVLVIIGIVLSVIYLRVFRFNDLVQEPKIDVL